MVAPDSSEVAVLSFDGVCWSRLDRAIKMLCVPFTVAFVFSGCTLVCSGRARGPNACLGLRTLWLYTMAFVSSWYIHLSSFFPDVL